MESIELVVAAATRVLTRHNNYECNQRRARELPESRVLLSPRLAASSSEDEQIRDVDERFPRGWNKSSSTERGTRGRFCQGFSRYDISPCRFT